MKCTTQNFPSNQMRNNKRLCVCVSFRQMSERTLDELVNKSHHQKVCTVPPWNIQQANRIVEEEAKTRRERDFGKMSSFLSFSLLSEKGKEDKNQVLSQNRESDLYYCSGPSASTTTREKKREPNLIRYSLLLFWLFFFDLSFFFSCSCFVFSFFSMHWLVCACDGNKE